MSARKRLLALFLFIAVATIIVFITSMLVPGLLSPLIWVIIFLAIAALTDVVGFLADIIGIWGFVFKDKSTSQLSQGSPTLDLHFV